jgi:hypothetical protein
MFDFWLDTDSFVRPYREAYRFDRVPKFWEFLEQKSKDRVIVSSDLVLQELTNDDPDELGVWAKQQQGTLFLAPTEAVQQVLGQIAESVKNNKQYADFEIHKFLSGADPWIIAHAKALGGRVVTFEGSAPHSKKPKIPDVAAPFEVKCLNLWDMLTELKASF